jgi:uncharacterized protein YgbK (DUF1537 family)
MHHKLGERSMPGDRISFAELCGELPEEWPFDPKPAVLRAFQTLKQKIVVLDDDPTGTQTVWGVPVLTEWSTESLRAELANDLPAFYILTNSRSVSPAEARALNLAIARNLVGVARELDRKFVVVSRSDSTLRGHFPTEIDALIEGLEEEPDGILLIPAFFEGGRYTIHDVQYVRRGEFLVSADETEFAQDASFGYKASNLRQWVEEKTGGRVRASEVHSVSITDVRSGGPNRVAERLASLSHRRICVVNSASIRDLEVFTEGMLKAELEGKRFIYRAASSFVPVRCGLPPHPLLDADNLNLPPGGGLIVVGSFVPTTTNQLKRLLDETNVANFEVDVGAVLDERRRKHEIERVAKGIDGFLRKAADVAVFTSRRLWNGRNPEETFFIGQRISGALVDIVRSISCRPRYIVAKGGITASDIATNALGVRRSVVKGQLLPGVPVWELGPESRHPGTPYVVFPGNVGDSDALIKVGELLSGASFDCPSTNGARLSS